MGTRTSSSECPLVRHANLRGSITAPKRLLAILARRFTQTKEIRSEGEADGCSTPVEISARRSCYQGKAHGQESADRGYPLVNEETIYLLHADQYPKIPLQAARNKKNTPNVPKEAQSLAAWTRHPWLFSLSNVPMR